MGDIGCRKSTRIATTTSSSKLLNRKVVEETGNIKITIGYHDTVLSGTPIAQADKVDELTLTMMKIERSGKTMDDNPLDFFLLDQPLNPKYTAPCFQNTQNAKKKELIVFIKVR